ncbi:MAG: hypothetical protein ACRD3P_09010, partial [Terriglobales bacterium]
QWLSSQTWADSSHLMDFAWSVNADLDAEIEFKTTDSIPELRDFRRDDLCMLNGVPAKSERPRNTPV